MAGSWRVLRPRPRCGLDKLALFGVPALILASDGMSTTLLFPRDRHVLRGVAVAEVLDATTGLDLDAEHLRLVLLGCLGTTGDVVGSRLGDWRVVDVSDARLFIRRGVVVAAEYRDWQIDYGAHQGGVPRAVRVRRSTTRGIRRPVGLAHTRRTQRRRPARGVRGHGARRCRGHHTRRPQGLEPAGQRARSVTIVTPVADTVVMVYAKVNLDLRILGERADGYHEVRTVLQSLRLHDTLTFTTVAGPLTIECDEPGVPTRPPELGVASRGPVGARAPASTARRRPFACRS